MAVLRRHPWVRWAVPATVVAVVGASSAIGSAQADSGLPAKSAQQLLVDVHDSTTRAFSGTVSASVDLGLPALPSAGGAHAPVGFGDLASGTHTMRVWADGPQRSRVSLLGDGGEASVIRDGRTVWGWNAQENTATKATLPAEDAASHGAHGAHDMANVRTPADAARLVLDRLDDSTQVSVRGVNTVAGRPAYGLVLTPKSSDTLVKSVEIDVDGATSMPLRVAVASTTSDKPVLDIGFTSFDPSAPAASTFAFSPPAGATVKTEETPAAPTKAQLAQARAAHQKAERPNVVGTGWSAVAVQRLDAATMKQLTADPAGKDANSPAAMLKSLPVTSGPWGSGRVVQTALFSAVLTDDGRMAVGAVPTERLLAALPPAS